MSHKNMKEFKYLFFSQHSEKNINLIKTEMEGHETALCYYTHISSEDFKEEHPFTGIILYNM